MKLSIVTTLYNSENYIAEFYNRSCAAAKIIAGDDFEVIFVNDGSPDDSLMHAINLHHQDAHAKVIDLSRNFGHHKAMMAGLNYASGEYVFLIDSDLEEEPEWLTTFFETLNADEFPVIDVVYGVQEKRKGRWFEKYSGQLFFWLINLVSKTDIPHNLVTARIMRRRYVDGLLSHPEREYFIAGLWSNTGFNQRAVTINKGDSPGSNYSIHRKLSIVVQSVLSFSAMPLRLICLLGIFISAISFLVALYLFTRRIFSDAILSGWTSLMVSVWTLGGLIILSIGIVGLYLDKVFAEVKRRPNHIVRELFGFENE